MLEMVYPCSWQLMTNVAGSDYRAVPAEGRPQSRGSARGEDLKVLRQRAESGSGQQL